MDNQIYEPDAWDYLGEGKPQSEAALISIAISMKRIADMMSDTMDYRFDEPAFRTRP